MNNSKIDALNYLASSDTHISWVKAADARVHPRGHTLKGDLTLLAMFAYFFGVLYVLTH